MPKPPPIKSVETKYYETRQSLFEDLKHLDRRSFMKLSAAAFGAVAAKGILPPHSFMPIALERGGGTGESFRIAYISDSHLYERNVNERFVRQLMRAVDDINQLNPQPDFVLYGGDLAQLGQRKELELGAQILKNVKAPLKMMVGEHDWYFDLGATWREMFGAPTYSFDHKGVHFVTLNSVIEDDFWTARGMTPLQRMQTVAGLDNTIQGRFQVGANQRAWLHKDLAKYPHTTPLVVFSHSPLYHYYRPWNFWTEDADAVQAILRPFETVVVIHGHTHQLLTNRIGTIQFHGMLSTAWPWPYAPEGLPELTVQMGRPNPFNPNDGLGDGYAQLHPQAGPGLLADTIHNLWNRNPVEVSAAYMRSGGQRDRPARAKLRSY